MLGALDALDARGLTLASAQIIELRAPHAAALHNFDRADHRGMQRKHAFDPDAETHAANGERCAGSLSAPADDHALKRLNAFLIALAFLQAHVHPDGVPGAKFRDVLTQLRLSDLIQHDAHGNSSLGFVVQTRSGGAGDAGTIANYTDSARVSQIGAAR
jgi:hypothetical protein